MADRTLDRDGFRAYLAAGPKYVGATTIEEQAWCRWFAAEIYSGQGALVEFGPWLGSLTTSYCEGLARNPRAAGRAKIAHVYDLFAWNELFEEWSRDTPHAGRHAAGDSFEAYFLALHARYEHLLRVVRADLAVATWDGAPIELIINDAAKSLRIADAIFRSFVPAMVPNASYVAHQDFLWSTDAYIQIFMYLARASFAYEHTVPGSAMAVFRNVRAFEPDVLCGYDVAGTVDYALIRETFAWSERTLGDVNPRLIRLCEAVVLRDFGFPEEALRIVIDGGLNRKQGNGQYDHQLETIRSWGYSDVVPDDV